MRILKVVPIIMNKNYPIRNWEEFLEEKKFKKEKRVAKNLKFVIGLLI